MDADAAVSEHSLRLPLRIHFEGPAVDRQRLQLRELLSFGGHIQTALDRVARVLQGEAESTRPGRRPGDIERLCALEIVSVRGGGSMTMTCDLPPVTQTLLGEYTDIGEQSLLALIEGLDDLSNPSLPLPHGYDEGVLIALRDAGKTTNRGVDQVSLTLGRTNRSLTRKFTPDTVRYIAMRMQGPIQSQRVVDGRLLMADFRESGLRCRVHPSIGSPVTCIFDEPQRDAVLAALTHFVRIVGEATEVGGDIQALRIRDIELLDGEGFAASLNLETGKGEEWSPSLDDLASAQGIAPIADIAGLTAGIWPEDESVDEFMRLVRKLRK